MKFFDAQIRSDTRTDDDLRNLAYFGTSRAVTSTHPEHRFEDADSVLACFDTHRTDEFDRLVRCGLRPGVALGLLPDAAPRRAFPKLWRALPSRLADPRVVAVGEIGVWEDTTAQWNLFDRQARAALEARLPVIVTPPSELRITMTYKMMARLQQLGCDPARCLMNRLDSSLLPTVIEEGFRGGLSVGQQQWEPRDAADIICGLLDIEPSASTHIILNSALRRGAADVLGVPKTVTILTDRGVPTAKIERLAYANAADLFAR